MGKITTYFNTIRYLKWSQLVYLVINRLKSKKRISKLIIPSYKIPSLVIPSLDYDVEWLNRFNIEIALNGRIQLLNEIVELNYSEVYLSHLSPLLRNNVLYMEYTIALAVMYKKTFDIKYVDCFLRLYEDYLDKECKPSSYIYSLHFTNLIITLNLLGDALKEQEINRIMSELHIQYRYIESHLEKHLLANHYLENLKVLVIGSLIFGYNKEFKKYFNTFKEELARQINNDGLHFELSSMYHKIILEDLLRVYLALQSFEVSEIDWLKSVIKKMTDAAFTMERGFNRTPLFNDAGDNIAKPLASLIDASYKICGVLADQSHSLKESGYYNFGSGNISIIIDCGKPGPEYQPGHVHNDCLSFELAYKRQPVFVNCGTLLYQGKERQFFRSTIAHNTVMIEGIEQSQCWGEHRVAKRSQVISVVQEDGGLTAEIEDYQRNRIVRKISLDKNRFSVMDSTIGLEKVNICSYLHIPLEFSVEFDEPQILIGDLATITPVNCEVIIHENCDYAPEFGKRLKCTLIEFRWVADNREHGYITLFNTDFDSNILP